MKNKRAYIMRPQKWSQYFNRDGEVVCSKCGEDINAGDAVVPRMQRREKGVTITLLYCIKCGDELNLLTDEEVSVAIKDLAYKILSDTPITTSEISDILGADRQATLDTLYQLWNEDKAKPAGKRRYRRRGASSTLWVKSR